MYVKRIIIRGFKALRNFEIELREHLNILVGNNETGKTTVLEAVNLVLSGQMGGRWVLYDLDPYYFNAEMTAQYFADLKQGKQTPPPEILIEAYLAGDEVSDLAGLKGTNNTRGEDCPGLRLSIRLDDSCADDFKAYVSLPGSEGLLPVEYYTVDWFEFSNRHVVAKRLPFRAKVIDTSLIRPSYGPDKYLAEVIDDCLQPEQRRSLATAYRQLKQDFVRQAGISEINKHLKNKGGSITTKKLTVSLDMSARSTWERSVTAHLDDIPFNDVGKGEQSRVQMKLAVGAADARSVLLIEEPENHLSYSNMSRLIDEINAARTGRQVLIATHSSFVVNKLGIDNLRLLSPGGVLTISDLDQDTVDYFRKLPGHDTLRLLLARKAILVEGPSDELILQMAFHKRYGKLPLADGIDVIAVRALSFKRFLEIGKKLDLEISVVTDNDGRVGELRTNYDEYLRGQFPKIRICFDPDGACPNLEHQLLRANSLKLLNKALGKSYENELSLLHYMKNNKTEYALRLSRFGEELSFPKYILDAIES